MVFKIQNKLRAPKGFDSHPRWETLGTWMQLSEGKDPVV
jgi:hypothetical protein